MIHIENQTDFSNLAIDKDNDIIPISMGLYRLFLAGGTDGLDAKTLYEHLIFTARLQETQRVFANNEYLRKGLQWGLNKVKHSKAWLVNAGLIEYVQRRNSATGTLSAVYIKIKFMLSRDTLERKLSSSPYPVPEAPTPEGEAPADIDDYQMDLFPEEELSQTTAPEDFTAGTVTAPPVYRTSGSDQQMLKEKKEMREEKKEKSLSPGAEENTETQTRFRYPVNPLTPGDAVGKEICTLWYRRYQKESARMQNPSLAELNTAKLLPLQFPALLQDGGIALAEKAIAKHFDLWREAWYLISEQTRKLPPEKQRPYRSFRNFCRFFGEILDLEKNDPSTPAQYRTAHPQARTVMTDEEIRTRAEKALADFEAGVKR